MGVYSLSFPLILTLVFNLKTTYITPVNIATIIRTMPTTRITLEFICLFSSPLDENKAFALVQGRVDFCKVLRFYFDVFT